MNACIRSLAKKAMGERRCRNLAAHARRVRTALDGRLSGMSPPQKAVKWLKSTADAAATRHSAQGGIEMDTATIALVAPTLVRSGEKGTAGKLLRWLMSIQQPDGSWTDPDGRVSLEATAAALDALLLVGPHVEGSEDAVRRAYEVVYEKMAATANRDETTWSSSKFPAAAMVSLARTAEVLDTQRGGDLVARLAERVNDDQGVVRQPAGAYEQVEWAELLIRLGRIDMAAPLLEALEARQAADGSVAACTNSPLVCSACLARLASCWYEAGTWKPADSALAWLERNQQRNGGFRCGHSKELTHGHSTATLLIAKYYLDANRHRVVSYMDRIADKLPCDISPEDGRTQAVLRFVKPGDSVVEVGCGKGRFLRAIHQLYPQNRYTGIDISAKLLAELGPGIRAIEGWLEDIPCEDNSFDVVFSVEAVEHSANIAAAVRELVRIAKPGGWVLIVDKQRNQWGRLSCPSWERWPGDKYLARLLAEGCKQVRCEAVSYNQRAADGLIVAWQGCKKRPMH